MSGEKQVFYSLILNMWDYFALKRFISAQPDNKIPLKILEQAKGILAYGKEDILKDE